jgi:hypothetical protein
MRTWCSATIRVSLIENSLGDVPRAWTYREVRKVSCPVVQTDMDAKSSPRTSCESIVSFVRMKLPLAGPANEGIDLLGMNVATLEIKSRASHASTSAARLHTQIQQPVHVKCATHAAISALKCSRELEAKVNSVLRFAISLIQHLAILETCRHSSSVYSLLAVDYVYSLATIVHSFPSARAGSAERASRLKQVGSKDSPTEVPSASDTLLPKHSTSLEFIL